MRRRPPTAEELEAARRAAEEARVRAGLEAVPPEELEFERVQAERRERRKRSKGEAMSERLTPEREAAMRRAHAEWEQAGLELPHGLRDQRDLLAEIDALRAELSDAEARGRAAEQADVVAWMRRDENYEGVIGRSWDAIERGEHLPKPRGG